MRGEEECRDERKWFYVLEECNYTLILCLKRLFFIKTQQIKDLAVQRSQHERENQSKSEKLGGLKECKSDRGKDRTKLNWNYTIRIIYWWKRLPKEDDPYPWNCKR